VIPLGKSLLPPEVLEQFPDDLPDEAAFIFWSGWQRGCAYRDEYWEVEMVRRAPVTMPEAPPVAPPPPVHEVIAPPTDYEKKREIQRHASAFSTTEGQEEPIRAFTSDTLVKFIDFARQNSSDPMQARLVVREAFAETEGYEDGNPPSSIARVILRKLDNAGILYGGGPQDMGDGDQISDEAVDDSAFG